MTLAHKFVVLLEKKREVKIKVQFVWMHTKAKVSKGGAIDSSNEKGFYIENNHT